MMTCLEGHGACTLSPSFPLPPSSHTPSRTAPRSLSSKNTMFERSHCQILITASSSNGTDNYDNCHGGVWSG